LYCRHDCFESTNFANFDLIRIVHGKVCERCDGLDCDRRVVLSHQLNQGGDAACLELLGKGDMSVLEVASFFFFSRGCRFSL
jgi:hypothetical protein